jgi:1-acyl-sn-glycerol-3-phosphate acyltransferase
MEFLAVAVLVALLLGWRWLRSGRTLLEAFGLDVARLYAHLWFRWSGGRSPLPAEGPAIVVANHTCSADPAFLLANAPRLFGFLTSREHYHVHPLIRRLLDYLGCVPVTRNGRDGTAARGALRRLAQGRIVCVFPEGNLSGVARGRPRAARHGAAYLALRSRAPVYPASISGGPHTDRLLRAWLWPRGKSVRVRFGPPVDLSAYYGHPYDRRLLEEVTNLLMARVLALRAEQPARSASAGASGWLENRFKGTSEMLTSSRPSPL